MNVRELVTELVKQDMDTEVFLSMHNCDPVAANDVEDNGEGQIVISYAPEDENKN